MAFADLSEYSVNACVILRPNNFDPPCDFLSKVDTLQDSHSVFEPHSSSVRLPHPAKGASPPGHAVVDGWRRDERTRDTPQSSCMRSSRLPSLPQLSRSYDLPPPRPRLAHSGCPQSRAAPPLTPTIRCWPRHWRAAPG